MKSQPTPRLGAAEAQSASEADRKVVIRYADGSTLRGYLSAEEAETIGVEEASAFSVRRVSGQIEKVRTATVKAIFFVKTFEGSRDYSEFKVFTNQPNGHGVWVRVQFLDGEIMEGLAPNSLETYTKSVFHLTPPDPASNNQVVLVSKPCLAEMQILGIAADYGPG